MAPPNGFQPASSLLNKATTTSTSNGTLRNASGGLPPIPKDDHPLQPAAENKDEATPVPTVKSKPINRPATSKNAIVYNAVQRRNPVLGSIKNVGIEIGDIVADYQVGTHNGVLFLR